MTKIAYAENYDDAFNLRKRHPNFQEYFDRDASLSRDVLNERDPQLNIPYGEHPLQTIDFFPAVNAKAPVFVFVHGGYWKSLDKDQYHFTVTPFLDSGYAAALINYRLAPEVTMDAIVADIVCALKWIHANAPRHNGDPNSIYLSGHSAGGHLAVMSAIELYQANHPASQSIKRTLSISGLFDLEPIRRSYLNAELKFDHRIVDLYSPARLAPLKAPGTTIFAVGNGETDEFILQSRSASDHFKSQGASSRCIVVPDRNHYDIVYDLADSGSAIAQSLLAKSTSD